MIKPELPKLPALKLNVDHRIPASWDFDLGVSLILLVPAAKHNALNKSPWADFLKLRLADFPAASNPVLISGPKGTRTAIAFVQDDVQRIQSPEPGTQTSCAAYGGALKRSM